MERGFLCFLALVRNALETDPILGTKPDSQTTFPCVPLSFSGDLETMSESESQEEDIAERMNARMERRRSRDSISGPEFQQELIDREVMEGDATRFEVRVTGRPVPKVTWYKDGEELEPSSRMLFLSDAETGVHSLLITQAEIDDEGEIRCVASNMGGSVACQAQLFVEGESIRLANLYT